MLARTSLVLAALTIAATPNTFADTWTVRLDGTGDFTTIQPALDAAAVGDTVLVADGTYTGEGNRDLTFGGKDLVVMSESDDPESCVIDCEAGPGDEHRGFVFDSTETGAAVLRGFTVRNGWVSGWGGGILFQSTTEDTLPAPRIERCVLTGNVADEGGGLAAVERTVPYLLECEVVGNTGGGACWTSADYWDQCGASIVESCSFDGNIGPGMGVQSELLVPSRRFQLRECSISDNTGSGLDRVSMYGAINAVGCTIDDNVEWGVRLPDEGGDNRAFRFASCQINGNGSGGVYNPSELAEILDCTVSYNHGPGSFNFRGLLDIVGCRIEHNDDYGVYIYSRVYLHSFHGNVIRFNGEYGVRIVMSDGPSGEIYDNFISGNVGAGLELVSDDDGYPGEFQIRDTVLAGNDGSGLVIDGDSFTTPLDILNTTIADNGANGIECLINAELRPTNTIIAFNDLQAIAGNYLPTTALSCCDLYANGAGDYTGILAPMFGIQGNISADPMFCGPPADAYTIHASSPCAPGNHPNGANCGLIGARDIGCSDPTAAATLSETALLVNAPNPFNPSTTIFFILASDETVNLHVYDLTGRLVRTLLADEQLPAGPHTARWQGRDDRGYPVPSGLYLYRLQAGNITETRRMALIK